MLSWMVPIVGGVAFLSAVGAYNRRRAIDLWVIALSGSLESRVAALEEDLALDRSRADYMVSRSKAALARSRLGEASRLLVATSDVVGEVVPGRLARLRGMALLCRLASAMAPLPPLLPASFRMTSLSTLAGLTSAFHYCLVSMRERFELRLWLLAVGYRVVRVVCARASNAASGGTASDVAWTRVETALVDLGTLDGEQVTSFRTLLASLTD